MADFDRLNQRSGLIQCDLRRLALDYLFLESDALCIAEEKWNGSIGISVSQLTEEFSTQKPLDVVMR